LVGQSVLSPFSFLRSPSPLWAEWLPTPYLILSYLILSYLCAPASHHPSPECQTSSFIELHTHCWDYCRHRQCSHLPLHAFLPVSPAVSAHKRAGCHDSTPLFTLAKLNLLLNCMHLFSSTCTAAEWAGLALKQCMQCTLTASSFLHYMHINGSESGHVSIACWLSPPLLLRPSPVQSEYKWQSWLSARVDFCKRPDVGATPIRM